MNDGHVVLQLTASEKASVISELRLYKLANPIPMPPYVNDGGGNDDQKLKCYLPSQDQEIQSDRER